MPEECACEVGVAIQQHRQFIQSCQVLFQWDRNSHYWYFLSDSEKSALAGLHKKPKRKVKQVGYLGKHWEERVHAHTLVHMCDGHVRASPWVDVFFSTALLKWSERALPTLLSEDLTQWQGPCILQQEVHLFAWAEPDESSTTRL